MAASQWRAGQTIIEDYRVERVLGEGGMGSVHLVRRQNLVAAIARLDGGIALGPAVRGVRRDRETLMVLALSYINRGLAYNRSGDTDPADMSDAVGSTRKPSASVSGSVGIRLDAEKCNVVHLE